MEKKISDVNRISKPGKYSNRSRDSKSKPDETRSFNSDRNKERKDGTRNRNSDRSKERKCFSCGENWPHKNGRTGCPAFGHVCQNCHKSNHLEIVCKSKVKFVDNSSNSSDSDYCYGIKEFCGESNHSSEYNASKSLKVNTIFNKSKSIISLKLNNLSLKFHVDSGSSVNIINEESFRNFENILLKKTSKKLFAYGSTAPLTLLGCFDATVESLSKIILARFYVVKGSKRMDNLIGIDSSMTLGILKIVNSVASSKDGSVHDIINRYDSIFHGIGKLNGVQVKLHIDESVKPVAQKHRHVPFHLREKVDQELKRLFEAGIIEPVVEPTDWVSPVVIVPKRDSSDIRLCVDMTQPNKAIKRIRHVIPTLDELRCDLNGATVFSKVDLNKGYHQLELDVHSRSITTFSTHAGLARFCRLNFGTSSATEIFHEEIRKLLQGVNGVINIHDDILITGKTQEDHDKSLQHTFQILKDSGLTLNKNKCIFSQSEIKFFGLVFNSSGISPDPDKVLALKSSQPPANKKELRSFLGMTNYI